MDHINEKAKRVIDRLHSKRVTPLDIENKATRHAFVEQHAMDFLLAQLQITCSYERYSDQELCRQAGLSPSYMHLLRNKGQLPTIKTLCQIAHVFDYALMVQFIDHKHLLTIVNDIESFNPLLLSWPREFSPGELERMREDAVIEKMQEGY